MEDIYIPPQYRIPIDDVKGLLADDALTAALADDALTLRASRRETTLLRSPPSLIHLAFTCYCFLLHFLNLTFILYFECYYF